MKEQIKEALEKATPGPWKVWERSYRVQVVETDGELSICEMDGGSYGMWQHNAHLIANTPKWLHWSVERIEQLEKVLGDIKSLILITQEIDESPSLRYNAENMALYKIDQALGKEE